MRDAKPSYAAASVIAVAVSLLLLLLFAPAAPAAKNVVGYFGGSGTGPDEISGSARGIVINEAGNGPSANPGDVYIDDSQRPSRIVQYDENWNWVRNFGWDVVRSGPDNTGANDQQAVNIPASVVAGTFKMKLTAVTGEGRLNTSSKTVSEVTTYTGQFRVGETVTGSGIPAGTTITAVGPDTLSLSNPASFNQVTKLTVAETTGPIKYNAEANTGTGSGNVQSSLETLAAVEPGDLTVTGGPGASGTPFTVTFDGGMFAHNDVPPIALSTVLTGGTATVSTVTQGGGPEVCNASASPPDLCHIPRNPDNLDLNGGYSDTYAIAGNLVFTDGLALDEATGNIFIADGENRRINVFRTDGRFQGAFGWGVVDGSSELQFCTVSCKRGLSGAGAGQGAGFAGTSSVDPTSGDLYVGVSGRVDRFSFTHNVSGEITSVSFVNGFGWGVDTGANAFEVCTTASTCNAGSSGSNVGQFSGSPVDVAVNSLGVVYATDNSRIQSFTPSGATYVPAAFVTINSDQPHLAIGVGDHLLVSKRFSPGTSTCYNGLPSRAETRILDFNQAGTLTEESMACAAFTFESSSSFGGRMAAKKATNQILVPVGLQSPNALRIVILDATLPPTATLETVTPTTNGVAVQGTISPNGPDPKYPNVTPTSYQLEYKLSTDSTWTQFASPVAVGAGFATHQVKVNLGGLEPKTSYDVRLVAQKPGETVGIGGPQSFTTLPVGPTINGLFSSGLTANSADLHAAVNPHGTDTTYHFEYGPTTAYGSQTPELGVGESKFPQPVEDHIEGLEPVEYHFRIVATNAIGTTISGDQTFTFYPPSCPNATVRQQNGSEYLPDCRAYELVSPPESGNVVFRPFGALSPYATDPPRVSFVGYAGVVDGTEAPNAFSVDFYVATRTTEGWNTTYPGIPATETAFSSFGMGNLKFDEFASMKNGCCGQVPYIYDIDENFLGRWPANAASIPGGDEAFGAFQPSPDFSHMAFSSQTDFDPLSNGLTEAPGSAYDYDVNTQETALISKTPGGADITRDPAVLDPSQVIGFAGPSSGMPVELFPAVSTDGSHILMTTEGLPCQSCETPLHLYMRVGGGGGVTYEIAGGDAVNYLGMTADGTKVFFTTDQQMTGDDHDSSVDLYMWSEDGELGGEPLTRLSAGSAGSGDTDGCLVGWTSKCGVVPADGTVETDHPIATASGDVYFYSPELLDGGTNGLEGGQNLYVYRDGAPRFVTTLKTDGTAPLTRIQVSSDGAHAAFVTKSRLTSYDNGGKAEMYSFDPASRTVACVSCNPSGEPPADDVGASNSGFFMSDDGRTFFSTHEALVSRDTNQGADVYEYVDGRPQLISSGTGATHLNANREESPTALLGVDVTGANVYFATYETLVSQDRNGDFFKIYVARTGGGFPVSRGVAPCEAADECHGPDSSPPPPPSIVSSGNMGAGGNAAHRKRKKHRHRKRHRAHKAHGKHAHGKHGRSRAHG